MKRIIALLLAICLLMCACGKKKKTDATEGSTGESVSQDNTQESAQDNTEESKNQEVLYRHPLTGAPLEAPWSGQVTAVMINNLKYAMPQCGISQADLFYEIEVEGDITRCLAVFSDVSKVGIIGPVRSARTAFNSVAVSYDAPLVHCGGSPGLALAGRYGATADTISNWEHIDQAAGATSQYFFRDTERYNNGYSWEHTLFTKGESLQAALEAKGYNTPTDKGFGLQFADGVVLNGEKAEEITIKFKYGKPSKFIYDAQAQQYKFYQHGQDHIDANTGKVVTFKNVIAIYTNQWYAADGMHKFYDTIGKGDGYAAINGKIVPISWSRESLRSPYTYTLQDGTPLTLDVGTTYVAVVGIKNPIAYQ